MPVGLVAVKGEDLLDGFDGSDAHKEEPKPSNDLHGRPGEVGEHSYDWLTIDPF